MIGKYCIIRADRAGVFAGVVKEIETKEGVVSVLATDVRRIWEWSGACSLSQMAVEGVHNPEECRFSVEVDKMSIFDVIELIPCSEDAISNIKGVWTWKSK